MADNRDSSAIFWGPIGGRTRPGLEATKHKENIGIDCLAGIGRQIVSQIETKRVQELSSGNDGSEGGWAKGGTWGMRASTADLSTSK